MAKAIRNLRSVKQYIFVNGGDVSVRIPFDGNSFTIPPRNQAQKPHEKFADVPSSYNIDGELMPGTLVVGDIKNARFDKETNDWTDWDIYTCIENKVGLQYEAEFGVYGIRVLEMGATKEEVLEALADSQVAFEESQFQYAQIDLASYEQQQILRKSLGLHPTPPPPFALRAQAIIDSKMKRDNPNYATAPAYAPPAPAPLTDAKPLDAMAALKGLFDTLTPAERMELLRGLMPAPAPAEEVKRGPGRPPKHPDLIS